MSLRLVLSDCPRRLGRLPVTVDARNYVVRSHLLIHRLLKQQVSWTELGELSLPKSRHTGTLSFSASKPLMKETGHFISMYARSALGLFFVIIHLCQSQ